MTRIISAKVFIELIKRFQVVACELYGRLSTGSSIRRSLLLFNVSNPLKVAYTYPYAA